MSKNQTETPGIKALPPSAAMFNKALQATPTALSNFSIRLSHNGLVVWYGLLPVVKAR
jgi:hypothetical protein